MYGITFPDKKQLAEHLERLEEAKKRDHRNVGTQMELFMFDKLSPGSCFFLPNGTTIYNTLVDVRPPRCTHTSPSPPLHAHCTGRLCRTLGHAR